LKKKKVNTNNLDEQTREEKQYLGSELFTLLQQVKKDFKFDSESEEDEALFI
jgi:hypothetical protein